MNLHGNDPAVDPSTQKRCRPNTEALGVSVSVILSTFNRSETLAATLEAMTKIDRGGLDVSFVVVDNNSTDATSTVIDSFADRLPLVHLFEPRPGKNFALNRALDSVQLGDIVVFTDDDVIPEPTWLHEIVAACGRWPDHNVFGGHILPAWPDNVTRPEWAESSASLRSLMFGVPNVGTEEREYPAGSLPFGANMWVRHSVFDNGRRYNTAVGPRPGAYAMGSETSFLLSLQRDGHHPVYCPRAVVGHVIQPGLFQRSAVRRRAIRNGRGIAHCKEPADVAYWRKHPHLWMIRRRLSVAYYFVSAYASLLTRNKVQRLENEVSALKWMGFHLESIDVVLEERTTERAALPEEQVVGRN